jgi:hypothetical protein
MGETAPFLTYTEDVTLPARAPMDRFRVTLDLHEFGLRVKRQNLRRGNPDASEAEISALLRAWLDHPPGAESGDCPGRPWPAFEA